MAAAKKTRGARTAKAPKPETALVLRSCDANMKAGGVQDCRFPGCTTSHPKFTWPRSGPVAAPDWDPRPVCGHGLHGLLWGEGDGDLISWADDAVWLVVEVEVSSIVDLNGKIKFPRGVVLFAGVADDAVKYLQERAPGGKAIVGGTATAGDWGTARAGYWGTATAGYRGTATAGDWGTATAGYGGTATAGYGGTATAGDWGTATAGDWGTARAGDGGTATAGDGGEIRIRWWDPKSQRYRVVVGYVGEDGIEPKTAYVVDAAGKLAKKPVTP